MQFGTEDGTRGIVPYRAPCTALLRTLRMPNHSRLISNLLLSLRASILVELELFSCSNLLISDSAGVTSSYPPILPLPILPTHWSEYSAHRRALVHSLATEGGIGSVLVEFEERSGAVVGGDTNTHLSISIINIKHQPSKPVTHTHIDLNTVSPGVEADARALSTCSDFVLGN